MHQLLVQEVAAHGAIEGKNLTQCGPVVPIDAKHAQALSMAFHELATNAVKHGAFSVDNGHIDVSWEIDEAKSSYAFGGAKAALQSKLNLSGGASAPTSSKSPYHMLYMGGSSEHFITMVSIRDRIPVGSSPDDGRPESELSLECN